MANQSQQTKTEAEYRQFLVEQVSEFTSILGGLEHNDGFLKLVDKWKSTNDALDASWHLIYDPIKLNEARITKFAAMELINTIETLKADLERAQHELIKLDNPTEFIHKDVEN